MELLLKLIRILAALVFICFVQLLTHRCNNGAIGHIRRQNNNWQLLRVGYLASGIEENFILQISIQVA